MTIDVKQMSADMAAGTPGPWISDAVFSYTGHATRVAFPDRYGVPGESIADCYQNWRDAENPDQRISWKQAEVNARRIARLPDLEAAYLAQAEENERLRAALAFYADTKGWNEPPVETIAGEFGPAYISHSAAVRKDRGKIARAALGETK